MATPHPIPAFDPAPPTVSAAVLRAARAPDGTAATPAVPATSVDALYILSAGHSGSTLLNLLLGAHPDAVAVGELTYLPGNFALRERCSCGAVVHECPRWRAVAAALESAVGIDLCRDPLALDLGYRDAPRGPHRATRAYRARWQARRVALYARLAHGAPVPAALQARFVGCVRNRLAAYAAVRVASGARVVVDASKEYLLGVQTWNAAPTRTRLVLLVRDGRAVYWSNLKRGFGREYSLRAWQRYYAHALPVLRAVPETAVCRVRYEALAADPAATLARVCEFAGLPFVPGMLRGAPRGGVQHVASGNDMRFRGTAHIAVDDQWRTALPSDERAYFEARAGALNAALGYE